MPKKRHIKGIAQNIGFEVSAKMKAVKIKHSGHINKDGTVTITFDGNKIEEVSKIAQAYQVTVAHAALSNETLPHTELSVSSAVSEPDISERPAKMTAHYRENKNRNGIYVKKYG